MSDTTIYQDIFRRTGGNIYLGIVGPVRTGKSTFVKRFLEQLVIPNITDAYRQQRARDELPQSGSGRTIMTSEPKFIPEEAVRIEPSPGTKLNVRLIDSVGYLIPGVVGDREEDGPRMVTTPWLDHEIPMAEAAELGTRKVMEDHCTAGVVITSDGSVSEFAREDYVGAEEKAIADMQATGKPFMILVNTATPDGEAVQTLCRDLEQKYQAVCMAMDCQSMSQEQICLVLQKLLYAFPVQEVHFRLPGWVSALEMDHPWKKSLYDSVKRLGSRTERINQATELAASISSLDCVQSCMPPQVDLGQGIVCCEIQFPQALFYQILGEQSGFAIQDDADLIRLLAELSQIKRSYDKVAAALQEVEATGYGVMMPVMEDMQLTPPEVIKKGSNYAVRMKATAPSIHMMQVNVQAEVNPLVGDENQTKDLLSYLEAQSEGDPEKLWRSNIFGRTVYDMVSDGLHGKLYRMPEQARTKFKTALTRVVNDGSGGLICILL